MTDSNRPGNDVQSLVEERRKFEGWLAALDARRESTPQHVFDRVRRDYESRMRQVEEQLAAHRHSILEEKASLESRRSLLAAEEQLRRDERAELELRAHVGELAGADADSAFKTLDDALGEMASEKETLSRRIGELDALLDMRPAEATPSDPAAEFSPEPSGTAPTQPGGVTAVAGEAPVPAAGETAAGDEKPGSHTPGGSFDELAFLSNVVGLKDEPAAAAPATTAPAATGPGAPERSNAADASPAAGVIKDDPASQSLLDDLKMLPDRAPLAANIPANTPIVLRSSGAFEQSKTLKCTECGALNYPTEWYCERCGAELAAL